MRGRVIIKDRAKTPSELSAEVAIAIDWLRRESYERAIETLTLVMVDLQRMELRAPLTAGRGRQRDHAPGRHSTDDRVRAAASPSSAGVLGPSRSAQPAPPHGASSDTLPDDVGCLSRRFLGDWSEHHRRRHKP